MKAFVALLWLAAATLALPQSEEGLATRCKSSCHERYRIQPSGASEENHPCFRGCQYFNLLGVSPSENVLVDDVASALSGCNADCRDAYSDEHERAQCNTGCSMTPQNKMEEEGRGMSFRIAIPSFFSSSSLDDGLISLPDLFGSGKSRFQDRMDSVEDSFKDIFDMVRDGLNQGLEEVRPNMESAMKKMDDGFRKLPFLLSDNDEALITKTDPDVKNSSDPAAATATTFGQIVANQFRDMMKWTSGIFGGGDSLLNPQDLPKGGKGRLVVIKSGPGYHQEKSYNIDSDTDISQIFNNDMMSGPNPLDDLVSKDVEVFDPKAALTLAQNDDDDDDDDGIDVVGPNFGTSFDIFGDKTENEIADILASQSSNNNIKDQPFLGHNIVLIDLCAQRPSQMTWSQWFACLHSKVGVPRWLMAATICSGIIFSIWLCLIIPSNLSKNKASKKPRSIGVKELEASANPHASVIILDSNYAMDLPPSYDDVTFTKVKPEPEASAAAEEQKPKQKPKDEDLPPPFGQA